MASVQAECSSCTGTGLYSGFCEPEGVAVICLRCGGSGAESIVYRKYERRKGRKDIKEVRRSRGTFIATGVGPTGPSMSYQEFLEAIPAAKQAS
jgi:hypothetical protein